MASLLQTVMKVEATKYFVEEEAEDLFIYLFWQLLVTIVIYFTNWSFYMAHIVMSFPEIKLIATEQELKSTILVMALPTY